MDGKVAAVTEAEIPVSDSTMKAVDLVSNGGHETETVLCFNSKLTPVKDGIQNQFLLGINLVDSRAKFGDGKYYLRERIQETEHFTLQFQQVCAASTLRFLCLYQGKMASNKELLVTNEEASREEASRSIADELGTPTATMATPLPQRGVTSFGGPSGLVLAITPRPSIGFAAASTAPPAPRRPPCRPSS